MSNEMKTYILELKGGNQRRITVPANWKVTFGPLTPGERNGSGTLALRFYESKENQRAIFTDVKSFRDSDIEIQEKVTKVKQQNLRRETPDGDKLVCVEARVSEWVDPDAETEPEEEFLRLDYTSSSED